MKLFMIVVGSVLSLGSMAHADVNVNRYVKSNGTVVQPYVRTAPDTTRANNYSTTGNYNPYTGTTGTKSLYK